ncbi:uncharacterized protein LOC128473059 [Spea bombifrons]|uniref:uncharacterized protein LOC128473059 n=1 Tax=Spea bombifrons TaxID=233779 RepID=UPI00234AA044|nr:uncharacterized protein LOC128473059 [Spea bombifrons]
MEEFKVADGKENQRWARYNSQVHNLEKKLGLDSDTRMFPELTIRTSQNLTTADPLGKAFRYDQKIPAGNRLQKEVLKRWGPSALETMMQSYREGSTHRAADSSPRQEIIDKILIRRQISRSQKQKHHEDEIRRLAESKEKLKKALKILEMQNEFFGNGRGLHRKTSPTMKQFSDIRKENQNTKVIGTNLLKDLETDGQLMDDVVEEIMTGHLNHIPDKMTSGIAKELYAKVTLENYIARAVLLIAEEIILETTMEMTKRNTTDVIRRLTLGSTFESQYDSAQVQEYLTKSDPFNF